MEKKGEKIDVPPDKGDKLPDKKEEKKNGEVQGIPQPVTAPALEVAPRSVPSPF
jgi:hypothetical protein